MRRLCDHGKTEKSEETALPFFNAGPTHNVFGSTANSDFRFTN
jgi:hypothetical protein